MSNNQFPKVSVLLVTLDGANPLGIARSLGRAGIPVAVLTVSDHSLMCFCRYVRRVYYVSAFRQSGEVQQRLETFLAEFDSVESKPIMIVTNESYYTDLFPLNDFIQNHFETINPFDKYIFLSEKAHQFPLAEQAGFHVSPTIMLEKAADCEKVCKTLRFPVIVKPDSNKDRGKFLSKTELFEDAATFNHRIAPLLCDKETKLIAQEFVPGADENIFFFLVSCGQNGEPRLWLSGHKIRQNPPGRGVMSAGVIDSVPDLQFAEKSKTLCRLFGLRGFIGIECKYHAALQQYCYIESSLRPDAYNSICFAAGIDIVLDSYLATIGASSIEQCKGQYKGTWADTELELGTMKILRQQRNPAWKRIFIPLPRPIAFAYFTWDDPMPFFKALGRLINRRIKAIFRYKNS